MRAFFLVIVCLLVLGCQQTIKQPELAPLTSGGQCKISLIDGQHTPEFSVNLEALESRIDSPELRRAYFAMGCFWGSEATLASANGVVSTRVGFSGGTLENPTYSGIGDHVETVEVVYDPSTITYPELLMHFWKHHNARAKPIFRQYASAIFCESESELELAKSQRQLWQESTGEEKVLTAILPFQKFYPAGDRHQKYYLQQDPELLKSLPESDTLLYSLFTTKLNAVAGRAGDRESLDKQLQAFGIEEKARETLFRRAVWP